MKATYWILASAIIAVIGGAVGGGLGPAWFQEQQWRQEGQELDRELADRLAFGRFLRQTMAAWQRGDLELTEASRRILEESRHTYPAYVKFLQRDEGTAGDGLSAEELVARDIQRQVKLQGN